jgi:hypothetical protein
MANVLERIKFGSETKGPAALAVRVSSDERGLQAAWIGHSEPELLERCDQVGMGFATLLSLVQDDL